MESLTAVERVMRQDRRVGRARDIAWHASEVMIMIEPWTPFWVWKLGCAGMRWGNEFSTELGFSRGTTWDGQGLWKRKEVGMKTVVGVGDG